MILHDWFDWTNSGVGVAGLALTAGALWQATGAKKAASDARQAVYRRNAAEDLARISDLSAKFLMAIETGQIVLALHVAREFLATCGAVREHHRDLLGKDGGKLEAAAYLVASASRGIQDGYEVADYIESAQRVLQDLSGVAGAANRKIDEEEG